MDIRVFLIVTLLTTTLARAQNKKDLLYEIENLKSELSQTKSSLAEAQKNEKASLAESEAHKTQALELQKINASLMQNLNSFTEASAQRSDNIGRTLETLKTKEAQLKRINDQFGQNDSIALLVLTNFKKTLGEDANIVVENGAVTTILTPTFLFGTNATSVVIDANAELFLEKMANVIKSNTDTAVAVESQTIGSDKLDLGSRRAAVVASLLINKFGVSPEQIIAYGKVGPSYNTYVKVQPKFDSFYFKVREDMKNSRK